MKAAANDGPVPTFVWTSPRDHAIAREIVDSQPVISAFAACEWEELNADGREWVAAIVREARWRAPLASGTIVRANIFLGYMADRFRARTAQHFLGIPCHRLTREQAMENALATFDAALEMAGMTFGDPAYAWDRAHADEFVDEELQHWEG